MTQLAIGDEFAGCRVEGVVGRGGMGVIYRGVDLSLDRPVAIKVITADRAGDESARRRFEREARLMAAIDHPNVIPVYAAGEQDGDLYLVMRYVPGTDLQQRLRESGPLPPAEAARIVDQVGRALDAAHDRGLVHRDIKPANVLLSGDHVYLTDFGITRLMDEHTRTTETGDWVGTLDFMSPEHLRGEDTDARSDVYSLGCVLYACLTGVPPYGRPTSAATISGHLHDRVPSPSTARPGVPRAFDQVVGRALAKRPGHRYPSAGALGEAAVGAAAGRPLRWGSTSPRRPAGTRFPRGAARTGSAEPARPPAQRVSWTGEATVAALPDARPTRIEDRSAVPTLHMAGPHHRHIVPRRLPWRLGATLALGAIVALTVVLLLTPGAPAPPRPFSTAQIRAVIGRFAAAYSGRDIRTLGELLAPAVIRITPTGAEHGLARVLADYHRQFAARPLPRTYRLGSLVINAGWVGRAAGTYTLALANGAHLRGHVTFAIQRIDGRAVIALIATQQDTGSSAAGL